MRPDMEPPTCHCQFIIIHNVWRILLDLRLRPWSKTTLMPSSTARYPRPSKSWWDELQQRRLENVQVVVGDFGEATRRETCTCTRPAVEKGDKNRKSRSGHDSIKSQIRKVDRRLMNLGESWLPLNCCTMCHQREQELWLDIRR
jgi:hypothetical protein